MATRTLLIAIDIEDPAGTPATPSDKDLAEGVVARLDEFYPTDEVTAVPANHRVAVMSPDAMVTLLGALGVGLDGAPEDDAFADEAWSAAQALAIPYANRH